MSAVDYLMIWSVLAAVGAFSSAMMLVAAERHGAHTPQAWLAAVCFFWEVAA